MHDYIGTRVQVISNLTGRTYLKALERMKAGMNWRQFIDEVCCFDTAVALVQELENSNHPTPKRIKIFKDRTGMGQATYYSYRKHLATQGQLGLNPPPKMKVHGKKPDEGCNLEEERHATLPDQSSGTILVAN